MWKRTLYTNSRVSHSADADSVLETTKATQIACRYQIPLSFLPTNPPTDPVKGHIFLVLLNYLIKHDDEREIEGEKIEDNKNGFWQHD